MESLDKKEIEIRSFKEQHKNQLLSSGVPEYYWDELYLKLKNQTFDAGNVFVRCQYENQINNSDPLWSLLIKDDAEINLNDPMHIYLIDHAWSFKVSDAKKVLHQLPNLLERMCSLMGIEDREDTNTKVECVFNSMWKYCQTYSIRNAENVEDQMPVWYIMDEVGASIEHSDDPNFRTVPFVYLDDMVTYTLLFPVKSVEGGQTVTRNFVEGSYDPLYRKALLLPWSNVSFLDVDFKQEEPGPEYFLDGHIEETYPLKIDDANILEKDRQKSKRIKVFTQSKLVYENLTDDIFEFTDNEEEADVLWYMKHFKSYKELFENSPNKLINQFPFEHVITIKDLLSIICRRKSKESNYDPQTLETYPKWLPTTFNLQTELLKFISYFQHREKLDLGNVWICKPWNLARGLDMHVTDNLNYIVRLAESGPKIVQKYIERPVLFQRELIGAVKFDIRYVLLLKSVKPLKVYAYRNFFLRFANEVFELKDFDRYEKHFTVMNYNELADLYHLKCDDFLIKWNEQYPKYSWSKVEDDIFKMFREIFEAAKEKDAPCGIFANPQSRAVYASDIMLEWSDDEKSNTIIQPKILEINWMPDCERACVYYPSFFKDIFKLLFANIENNEVFCEL